MSYGYQSQELKKAILSQYHNGLPHSQIVAKMNFAVFKSIKKVLSLTYEVSIIKQILLKIGQNLGSLRFRGMLAQKAFPVTHKDIESLKNSQRCQGIVSVRNQSETVVKMLRRD